jgi:hypothetical protein
VTLQFVPTFKSMVRDDGVPETDVESEEKD